MLYEKSQPISKNRSNPKYDHGDPQNFAPDPKLHRSALKLPIVFQVQSVQGENGQDVRYATVRPGVHRA